MDPSIRLYDEPTKFSRIMKEIALFLILAAAAVLAAFCLVHFCTLKVAMTGKSMDGTLQEGDEVLVNKMSYLIKGPKQNDVIVFLQGGGEHSFYNIKRVIGLPGDTVQIKEGKVYVNEEPYTEVIPGEEILVAGLAADPILLEENEYFVLGDNRSNSEDSRFANVGMVLRDDIVGKAWIRTAPEFGFVNKLNSVPEE